MAKTRASGRIASTNKLDMGQILQAACSRVLSPAYVDEVLQVAHSQWLPTAEICAILRNHDKFPSLIATGPRESPSSGSLFLVNRRQLTHFKKDGHNWNKKKDGKKLQESLEKLKVGGVPLLQCYYAHGQKNGNFQRRTYWRLKESLEHMVLVHYLEIQRKRKYFNHLEISNLEIRERADPNNHQYTSSPKNQQQPEYEDIQSVPGDVRKDLFPNNSGERQGLIDLQHTAEESQQRECNVTEDSENVDTSKINDPLDGLDAFLNANWKQTEGLNSFLEQDQKHEFSKSKFFPYDDQRDGPNDFLKRNQEQLDDLYECLTKTLK